MNVSVIEANGLLEHIRIDKLNHRMYVSFCDGTGWWSMRTNGNNYNKGMIYMFKEQTSSIMKYEIMAFSDERFIFIDTTDYDEIQEYRKSIQCNFKMFEDKTLVVESILL